MPTLAEQLAAVDAKLDAFLPTGGVAEQQPAVEISASDLVAKVAKELGGEITKQRAVYLAGLLEQIGKSNFEGTNTYIPIPVVDDPMRVKPSTEKIATIQTLTTGTPDSLFASNLKQVLGKDDKVQLIVKMLQNQDKLPEAIKKSKLTDKLDDIKTMFGIVEDDLKDEYSVRWKVGDLISALQTAIKLERLVNATAKSGSGEADPIAPTEPQPGTPPKPDEEIPGTPPKPAGDPPPEKEKPIGDPAQTETGKAALWPTDMAAAALDPVSKAYKRPELPFGYDGVSRR